MIALKKIRENAEFIKENLEQRDNGKIYSNQIDQIVLLDKKCRNLKAQVEKLRSERNATSAKISLLFNNGAQDQANKLKQKVSLLKSQLVKLEKQLQTESINLQRFLNTLPNLLHKDTPIGKDSKDNVIIKKWGTIPEFSFKPQNHKMIGEALEIIDLERGAKITGSGFPAYKGYGALLERALINFMIDLHTTQHNYQEMWTPFMVNQDSMYGTGQLPKFKDDLFWIEGSKYGLVPTAEVPLTNFYRNEILLDVDLPKYFTAYTPCFRQEAGQHGEETRGLIRVHQFNKVELVKICKPENSYIELEKLTKNAEKVLQLLNLPYRIITLCSGDTGFSAAKTYDIEVWLPSQNKYREISSCSNCTDFQARRMNLKYKEKLTGKTNFVHTLNGSGLAVGRTWVAIIENYQQEDGSIIIPKVLRSYMHGLEQISKI